MWAPCDSNITRPCRVHLPHGGRSAHLSVCNRNTTETYSHRHANMLPLKSAQCVILKYVAHAKVRIADVGGGLPALPAAGQLPTQACRSSALTLP